MSALDTAKEIGRMAATATLSKDVIDLFEKKVALLAEQVTALERENKDLKAKAYDLEKELERLQPKSDRLEEGAEKLLALLFQRDRTPTAAAHAMGIAKGMVEYYHGVLVDRGFAAWQGIAIKTDFGESEADMAIRHEGRTYCVKYGLVK